MLTTHHDGPNPLDHVEEILSGHNWDYHRTSDDELNVKITSKSENYTILFVWQETTGALQFRCQYDTPVSNRNMPAASLAILEMNRMLLLGHFEIARVTNLPSFRHTCFLRGLDTHTLFEHLQDLVDISLTQCERFRQVFLLLGLDQAVDNQIMSLAVAESQGAS